jgi:hypothetical protein
MHGLAAGTSTPKYSIINIHEFLTGSDRGMPDLLTGVYTQDMIYYPFELSRPLAAQSFHVCTGGIPYNFLDRNSSVACCRQSGCASGTSLL